MPHGWKSSWWLAVGILASATVVIATELLTPRAQWPSWPTLALNVGAFGAVAAIAFAATARFALSIALAGVLYELLVISNRLKLRYLGAPVHPADLFTVANVRYVHLFSTPVMILMGVVGAAMLVALVSLLRLGAARVRFTSRLACAGGGTPFLAVLVFAGRSPQFLEELRAAGVAAFTPNPVTELELDGLLLGLLLHVGDVFVAVPPYYDAANVRRVIEELAPIGAQPPRTAAISPVNLAIFVVEAMMDPADLGLRFTSDPMPFLADLRRRYSSGCVISPEIGGRSANPEFEIFSGLAMYFLPRESVPYMT